jgi:SNF2-related domain
MKSSKATAGNPVQQLNLLRSFVNGATTTIYTEKDLLECLKQSGYNVQRAAELLITGQYCCTGTVRNIMNGATRENTRAKSAFFRSTTVSSPARKKEVSVVSSRDHSASTNGKTIPPLTARVSMTPAPTTITVSTPTATPRRSISARKSLPRKAPFSVPRNECASSPRMNCSIVQPKRERFLLCRRWISDATITCRTASVRYREVLSLDFTHSGYCRVGFRSARNSSTHGKLPDNIAILLSPLLRYQSQEPLLDVVMESMIDDPALVMGSSLPIQITIYLISPKAFFDLMIAQASDTNPVSAASQYFVQRRSRAQSKKRKASNLQVHEAAFLLLQWAQYGDVPEFETAADVAIIKNEKIVVFKEQEVIDIEDSQCTPSDTDNEDENELQELNEEDFESELVEAELTKDSVLESFVERGNDSWTSSLPDDFEDPVGLAEHVTLRSYQKQALYFMFQRETTGMNRDQLEDQLRLLEDMVAEQTTSKCNSSWNVLYGDSGVDIVCDCGPVYVSENGRKRSTTLTGTTDPISHPLWQRRYLASPCFTRSITFFVNELLGTATYVTPEPPKHCSGGILADAMGLGKTVMLLALILRSKESLNFDVTDRSPKATLVIAKLSLLPQWEEELKSKTNLNFKIFYGSNTGKPIDVEEFLQGVVSYAMCSNLLVKIVG